MFYLVTEAAGDILETIGSNVDLRSSQSPTQPELATHAFYTMYGIDVFYQSDLVARCRSLS